MLLEDLPIQKKLLRFTFLVVGIVLFTNFLTFFVFELYNLKESTAEKLYSIGKVVSYNSNEALAKKNSEDAYEILDALRSDPHIVAASLYDKDGKIFATYPSNININYFPLRPEPQDSRFMDFHVEIFLPVSKNNIHHGTLYLKSDLVETFEKFKVYGIITILSILLSILFSYLLSENLKNIISKPIISLVETSKKVSEGGDYSIRSTKFGKDELGTLTDAFNAMLNKIEAQNKTEKEFNKDLENKVLQRTIEIEGVNKELKESEQRLQSIFNSAPDAIIVINDKSIIEKWNRKAEELFGWNEMEVIGKPLYEYIIPERYREAHKKGMKHYLETGEGPVLKRSVEIEAVNKKGGEFSVLLGISPVDIKDKILFIGFIRDITEKKKAENELQRSNERFMKIFDTNPVGMVMINKENQRFVYVNAVFLEKFGFAKQEVIGKTEIELNILTPETREKVKAQLQQTDDYRNFEATVRKKNGETFWSLNSIHQIAINNEIFALISFYDISERKKNEDELKKSNERFYKIFENNSFGMSITDLETNVFQFVNEAFLKNYGYTKEEVIGKTGLELNLINHEPREIAESVFKQSGSIKEFEVLIRKKNGEKIFVNFSTNIIELDGKKYALTSFFDITARKKAEEQLKNSEYFLNTIIENIPTMLFVKDGKDLKFVRFNKAGEELLGYSKQELIGKNDYDFFPKEQADFFTSKDRKVFETKQFTQIPEESIQTRYKGERILETKKIPIFDDRGKPAYLLGISNDITEQKIIQTELKHKSEELERSNKELEQFAYIASHDLQEPLRMVSSYLQLLERRYKDKLDTDANEFINYAVDGSNRMRTLIFALLDYSRVNRVKPFEDIKVNELLNEVLKDLSAQIKDNNATIQIDPLPEIYGDKVLIGQLFQNLISNAVKFKGERNPEIVISGKRTNGEYLFSVKDNGIGIQKEYADKLFVIFQRLNTKEQYPGTGIGLAICKKIVEKHGGKIWFESEFGKGSTFYFTLKAKTEKQKLAE